MRSMEASEDRENSGGAWYPGKCFRESIFCPECCGGENHTKPYETHRRNYSTVEQFSGSKCRYTGKNRPGKERRGEYWLRSNKCIEGPKEAECNDCWWCICCPISCWGCCFAITCLELDCCNKEALPVASSEVLVIPKTTGVVTQQPVPIGEDMPLRYNDVVQQAQN